MLVISFTGTPFPKCGPYQIATESAPTAIVYPSRSGASHQLPPGRKLPPKGNGFSISIPSRTGTKSGRDFGRCMPKDCRKVGLLHACQAPPTAQFTEQYTGIDVVQRPCRNLTPSSTLSNRTINYLSSPIRSRDRRRVMDIIRPLFSGSDAFSSGRSNRCWHV